MSATVNSGRFEAYWANFCFFRGWLPADELAQVREYAIVSRGEGNDRKFFLVKKEDLQRTRAMTPTHSSSRCLEFSTDSTFQQDSTKVHLVEGRTTQVEEITNNVLTDDEIYVHNKERGTFPLKLSDIEPTAGLFFTLKLREMRTIQTCQPWVCEGFLKGRCHNGNRCLYIHVPKSKLPESRSMQLVEAQTPIRDVLPAGVMNNAEVRRWTLDELPLLGLLRVGDVQALSNQAFESFTKLTEAKHSNYWSFLHQLRMLDENLPITMALAQFHGIAAKDLDLLPDNLTNLRSLLNLKPKHFYALGLSANIIDVCEKLRSRFEVPDQPTFSSIKVSELPEESFFPVMAKKVCGFRATHAHKSWRKQDATRPIVTSLITYVNPDECECRMRTRSSGQLVNGTPGVGCSPMNRTTSTLQPGMTANASGVVQPSTESRYPEGSWCTCERMYELAVNYELSTPSGSRCSEQNALGRIASMGLPTDCIREVFVHGGTHDGQDPNPLFPCGVCENMFGRVSKDVLKNHGSDVMLYMFDSVENSKKLVCLPVREISHRKGASFKRFVEEDLKDDTT